MSDRPTPPNLTRRLQGALRDAQERALGRRAVAAGLLTLQELEGLLGQGARVADRLRAKGVAADRIRQLETEIDRDEYAVFRPDRRVPAEVEAALRQPDRRRAEFVLVSPLGQGGLGEVWKAWDTRLGRWVALKLPAGTLDQEVAAGRFTREALAAARLSHPNIVSIHRVAEEEGRCFIVMQYVEGKTLGHVRPDLKQSLVILRAVALAVHYAHEQGVIHRDLKPSNIMIGPDGRPFVLDFGLAHLQEAGRAQSRDRFVAGTAAYMSPEQARGEPGAREPATDIYSLGATLYEMATALSPYDGETFAETLEKVLYREPRTPRALKPDLPRDVETVILKAMDKDPHRRYATARELAEDLDRCLRDEPIAARRDSIATMRRGLRRHPRKALAILALALVAGAAFGWFEMGRRERHRHAREITEMAVQALLGLRRAGANERMAEWVPRLEASYKQAVELAPGSAEIESLMGRAYRLLMDDKRAMQCQERALRKESGFAAARYESFVLCSRKDSGVLLIHEAPPPLTDPSLGQARILATKGFSAYMRREYAQAREFLANAVAADAGLEEAWETYAQAWLDSVTPYSPVADQERAYRQAEQVFTQALERDRGYVHHWSGRAAVWAARARFKRETGQDPITDFQSAEDDCTEAIKRGPSAAIWARRAALRADWGVHRMRFGENPLPQFEEADADLQESARIDPADRESLRARARLAVYRAEYRLMRGGSPEEFVEAFEKLSPEQRMDASSELACLWGWQAIWRLSRGESPAREQARSDEFFAKAAGPESLERRAFFKLQRRPPDLAGACRELADALKVAPFFNRGRITRAMHKRMQARGEQDPHALYAEAAKELSQVLEINPLDAEAWVERGHLELDRGRARTRQGDAGSARDHYAQSIRSFEEGARLNSWIAVSLREPLRNARRALLGN